MMMRIAALTGLMLVGMVAFDGAGEASVELMSDAAASCIEDPVNGGCVSMPCVKGPNGKTCVPCKVPKYNIDACLY